MANMNGKGILLNECINLIVILFFFFYQAIDIWMGACTAFVFAALIEFTVVI